jgi:hypothetical protein
MHRKQSDCDVRVTHELIPNRLVDLTSEILSFLVLLRKKIIINLKSDASFTPSIPSIYRTVGQNI